MPPSSSGSSLRRWFCIACLAVLGGAAAPAAAPQPVARWKLDGNTDEAGGRWAAQDVEIEFVDGPGGQPKTAAFFNGRTSRITVPRAGNDLLNDKDFTLTAWIRSAEVDRFGPGDLLHCFDSAARRGVTLSLAASAPGFNGPGDDRQVQFGIDDGVVGDWQDCGRPLESNSLVTALVVHDAALYAGIADAAKPAGAARVFRWSGGKKWVDCGRLGDNPRHLSAQSLITHKGRLYAGTGIHDWEQARGQVKGLPAAAETRVYEYQGGQKWRDLGRVGRGSRVLALGSFGGQLFAGLDDVGAGEVWRYDGQRWVGCRAPDGRNVTAFCPFDGGLCVATHGNFYRYVTDGRWEPIGREPHGIQQVFCLTPFEGRLHAGTWPQGYVLGWQTPASWQPLGRLGVPPGGYKDQNAVCDLTVHLGKLYAAVAPLAEVYRYDGGETWTPVGTLAQRADWNAEKLETWLRVTCLTPYQGRLFAATGAFRGRSRDVDPRGSCGRVWSLQTGAAVASAADLGTAWTHVTAVRAGRELRLFLDGRPITALPLPGAFAFQLKHQEPLLIGAGAQGSFRGAISDLCWYDRALTATEITTLAARP